MVHRRCARGESRGERCRFRISGERSRPMASVKAIPEGYHSVTPYLIIDGAAAAIEFYEKVFGAVEVMRMPGPDGRLGHAEIKIGDSHVMLADENPEMNARSPKSVGGSPISIA